MRSGAISFFPWKKTVSFFSMKARRSAFAIRIFIAVLERYFSKPHSFNLSFHFLSLGTKPVSLPGRRPELIGRHLPNLETMILFYYLHCRCKRLVLVDVKLLNLCLHQLPFLIGGWAALRRFVFLSVEREERLLSLLLTNRQASHFQQSWPQKPNQEQNVKKNCCGRFVLNWLSEARTSRYS